MGGGALRKLNRGRAARVFSVAVGALLCATGIQTAGCYEAFAAEEPADDAIQPAGVSTYAPAGPQRQGWVNEDGAVYYYENGKPVTGWKEYWNPGFERNETCYFGKDGVAVSGWQTIDGKQYYFGEDGYHGARILVHGAMVDIYVPGFEMGTYDCVFDHGVPLSMEPGWLQTSSGEKYFFVSKGKLAKGWQGIDDKDYYFNTDTYSSWGSAGRYMVTGPVYLYDYDGAYLFDADGVWHSQPGWTQLPTGERCYVNSDGKLALGIQEIDGKLYHFASENDRSYWHPEGDYEYRYPLGALMTGLYTSDDGRYYSDSSGVVQTGWTTVGDKKYYFFEEDWNQNGWNSIPRGARASGWKTIDGKTYYFGYPDDGVMRTGKQVITEPVRPGTYYDKLYLFGDDGALYENPGWLQMDNGDWYYIDSDSTLATGWKDIGGESYYFGEDGVMRTGFYWANGQQYWSDPNGVWHQTAWRQDSNGWWFDFGDGSYAQNSWQPIDNEWYHFDSRGYMQVGWLPLGGVWYYLGSSGAMHTGWLYDGGVWYYLNGDGDMATGWKSLGGTWYYLNGSGAMQVGWLRNGGAWYYLNGGGDMATGWRRVDGAWYFLNPSGDMATGWKQIGGTWYYLSGSGDMAESRWVGDYWLGSDGAMATNAWVDGGKYYVGPDGAYDPNARR